MDISGQNASSLRKASDFQVVASLICLTTAVALFAYAIPDQLLPIILFVGISSIIWKVYKKIINKLASAEQQRMPKENESILSQISPRSVIAGNLANIVSTVCMIILWTVYTVLAEAHGGSSGIDVALHWKAVGGSISLTIGLLSISLISPVYAGCVAAKVANRSEILNGALSTLILLLRSVYLNTHDQGHEHWQYDQEVLVRLFEYGAPALGAIGGHFYGSLIKTRPNFFETHSIGYDTRLLLVYLVTIVGLIFCQCAMVNYITSHASSPNTSLGIIIGAFVVVDVTIAGAICGWFLLRNWIAKSLQNRG